MKKHKKIIGFIKKHLISLILILISPIIIISFLSFIVNFGTKCIGTKEIIIDLQKAIDVGSYIDYYVTIVGIEVTAILSYYVWQTSVESNKLAEEIKNKEDRRDFEIIKENALIVYYDLLLGLSDLRSLYISGIAKKESWTPRRMFFSSEWIKNTAILNSYLDRDDVNVTYNLYGKLSIIQDFLSRDSNEEDLKREVESLFKEVFDLNIYKCPTIYETKHIEKLLKKEYRELLERIENITYLDKIKEQKHYYDKKTNELKERNYYYGKKRYEGDLKDYLFDGEGKYYDEDNKLIFEGTFEKGKLLKGYRKEYYDNGDLWFEYKIENGRMDENEKVLIYSSTKYIEEDDISAVYIKVIYEGTFKNGTYYTGKGRKFNIQGKLEYDGEFVDGLRHGKGESFEKGKLKYRGTFKRNIVKGKEYWESGILKYEGTFLNNKYDGKGIEHYYDGKLIYKGSFKHGNYEGLGTLYKNNPDSKELHKGMFKKGKLITGERVVSSRGNPSKVYYEYNIEDGNVVKGREYYINENLKYEGEYNKGYRYNGKGKLYDQNGELMFEGEFKDNSFYTGEVFSAAKYENHDWISCYYVGEIYENPDFINCYYVGEIKEKTLHGEGKIVDEKGALMEMGTYQYGKLIKKETTTNSV